MKNLFQAILECVLEPKAPSLPPALKNFHLALSNVQNMARESRSLEIDRENFYS